MKTKTFMVGDYQVEKKLGSGSCGKVFLGVNKTGDKVAIKFIEPKYKDLALKEAHLLNLCEHEHVLQLQAWDFNEQMFVMVLDLMKGSLETVRTHFTFEEIKRLMKQFLLAVDACHERNVCHRDIKPDNILLDAQNNLKLADFSVACESEHNATSRGMAFCPMYRPPEVILGDCYDGYKADMWAVGLVFAFLLLKNQHLFKVYQNPDNNVMNMKVLEQICGVFGKPDEITWPGVSTMRNYHLLENIGFNGAGLIATLRLRHSCESCPPKEALQLLEQMLIMDPTKRITAKEALQSEYFV